MVRHTYGRKAEDSLREKEGEGGRDGRRERGTLCSLDWAVTRLALNSKSSVFLCPLSAGIKGFHHHSQLMFLKSHF